MTISRYFGAGLLTTTIACAPLVAQTAVAVQTTQTARPPTVGQAPVPRDGQHDFDFGEGTWHTHIIRTPDPFNQPDVTITIEGTVSSRKVWGGRAWLEEIQADGPKGHWEAMTLFLYNPQAHQWSMNFINSPMGVLAQPLIGSFSSNRRGPILPGDTLKATADA